MKKLILPLFVFAAGLLIADHFFAINVPELFRGFGNFLLNLFAGTNR
jgi:hypothetical protein